MIVYATTEQLSDWMDDSQEEASVKPLLRKASGLVRKAIRNDLYDTLPSGLPEDDDLTEALREATCAQVEVWLAAGITSVAGTAGVEPEVVSSSIDGASLSFDVASRVAARQEIAGCLSVDALDILRAAGLASAAVQ